MNHKQLDQTTLEKYNAINRFLEETYLLAHIDPKIPGVDLPEHLRNTPWVTLKLSRYFRGGVEVLEDRIVTDLLFGDNYYTCTIPLASIWRLTSEKGNNLLWAENAPEGLAEMLLREAAQITEAKQGRIESEKNTSEVSTTISTKKRPQLKRVK